jgi:hypothetical protein
MRDRAIEDWVAKLARHMAAREYAAIVEPDIRADERRRVREELLAIAEEEKAAEVAYFRIHGHVGAYHLTAEEIADRIAPKEEDQCTR